MLPSLFSRVINKPMSLRKCFTELLSRTVPVYERRRDAACIYGLQHILPSQEQLFGAIKESHIARGWPIIMGKHYSTVACALAPENYLVHDLPDIFYKRGHFEVAFKNLLKPFCERLEKTVADGERRSVIILDDGGYVSGFLVEKFLRHNCRVVIVEQTTSGLKRARNYPCPVVSVASSILKREVESIFIAESVLQALQRRAVEIPRNVNCGIIGFGAVGSALCHVLREGGVERICVFDRNHVRRTAAATEGFTVLQDVKAFVEDSDLVFGCTGEDIGRLIDPGIVRRAERELLCVSCGSSDGEFASWISSRGEARLYRRDGRIGGNGFDDIEGQFGCGRFRVLNGGFPMNLDRSAKSDPIDDFVLTRMLVFCGILQAVTMAEKNWSSANSVVSLHKDFERAVHDVWFDSYPKRLSQGINARTATQLGLPQRKLDS